ncbi:MAG: glycosyl transferase group 1 [Acidobacteria bacterium]|nr:glycosyl transferase group 1 [Acidobacteriota bacterium]
MLGPTVSNVLHTLGDAGADRLRRIRLAARRRPLPLRIGIDIRPFYEPLTGIGWYLHFLLHELSRHDDVELYLFGDARLTDLGPRLHAPLPPNARYCTFDLRGRPVPGLARPLTAGAYVGLIELSACDVFFAANYFLPRLHSAVARRRVITVHDLTFKRFPELLQRETLENLERQMLRELALADSVICVSESTRRDLLHYYQVDPRRAVTIHSGLGTQAEPEPMDGLPGRYLLFVSTIEPRKNLATLLDAYERLRASGRYDGALVVVGRIGWKSEELVPRLKRNGIVHLDYLDAGRLATVYRRADAFVFPSLYEGFGFPLLEAMAHGVPTVAARSSSLPEIGGEATLWFDPLDVYALETQLRRVTSDPALRADLIARGYQRAAQFRWDTAADQTLAVLRRAAE